MAGPVRYRPRDVLIDNLMTAMQALAGRTRHWLVRDQGFRYRVGVPEDARPDVLRNLEGLGGELRVEMRRAGQTVGRVRVAELGDLATPDDLDTLRIYGNHPSGSPAWRYGARYGADIEFWRRVGEFWQCPRSTLVGDRLHVNTPTTTITIGERAYPTFEPFTRSLPSDIAFPIDVVYTWVDGQDPHWRARFTRAQRRYGGAVAAEAHDEARFRDRDELRYSLRSLDMFAPWVRNIFIVTDGQVPAWLSADSTRARIVDHREILSPGAALPTFNSFAIETALHRIEGLTEQFIYFNDDMLLGAPVAPSSFFLSNGSTRFFPSRAAVPFGPTTDGEHSSMIAARNNRQLLERTFGWTLTHAIKHAPYALRRSVLAEIAERFPYEVNRTANSPFRSVRDISVVSSLHHWYGLLTGRSVEATIRSAYVDTANPVSRALFDQLLAERRVEAICVNDGGSAGAPESAQRAMLSAFMRNYYPIPALAEHSDPVNPA